MSKIILIGSLICFISTLFLLFIAKSRRHKPKLKMAPEEKEHDYNGEDLLGYLVIYDRITTFVIEIKRKDLYSNNDDDNLRLCACFIVMPPKKRLSKKLVGGILDGTITGKVSERLSPYYATKGDTIVSVVVDSVCKILSQLHSNNINTIGYYFTGDLCIKPFAESLAQRTIYTVFSNKEDETGKPKVYVL